MEHFILEIIGSLPNMEMMINVKDYPLVRINLCVHGDCDMISLHSPESTSSLSQCSHSAR